MMVGGLGADDKVEADPTLGCAILENSRTGRLSDGGQYGTILNDRLAWPHKW